LQEAFDARFIALGTFLLGAQQAGFGMAWAFVIEAGQLDLNGPDT